MKRNTQSVSRAAPLQDSRVRIVGAALTLLLLISMQMAQAAPLTWTFVNATASGSVQSPFSYSITGSFDFDATTVSFSNVNVTLTGTGDYAGTYTQEKSAPPLPSDNDYLWFVMSPDTDYTLDLSIRFYLDENMTAAGGQIDLSNYYGVTCLSSDCNSMLAVPVDNGTLPSSTITGYVTSELAPIPVPAALPLMLTGLAGLGVLACRRREKI